MPGDIKKPLASSTPLRDRGRINLIYPILPFFVTSLHIFLSPYTKVEETPALHAIHDIITHGFSKSSLQHYEHVKYPGAVPRSMIPSLVIAGITKPIVMVLDLFGLLTTGLQIQTITRFVLAFLFSISMGHLTLTLHRQSPKTAMAFSLLSVTQFHVPYYAGRTLPNFLALPLVIYAFSTIIRSTDEIERSSMSKDKAHNDEKRSISIAIALLTFSATVIRLEIAPLLLALTAVLVLRKDITIQRAIVSGAIGGINGLALTSSVDGMFYALNKHPISWWPELSAFIFNIPQGRAAEWGVMPWSFYVTSLPKLLLSSLVFWNTGYAKGKEVILLAIPCFILISTLSLVGHKEWRFIVYVVPLLNVLAAQAITRLWSLPYPFWRSFWRLAFLAAIMGNIAVTTVLTVISVKNYPGGEIGTLLESLHKGNHMKVWVPAAALHSGATVYTLPPTHLDQMTSNMTVIRPESSYEASHSPKDNSPLDLWDAKFDLVVTDDWASFEDLEAFNGGWEIVGEVEGYRGVQIQKKWPFAAIRIGRRLAIMGRREVVEDRVGGVETQL